MLTARAPLTGVLDMPEGDTDTFVLSHERFVSSDPE